MIKFLDLKSQYENMKEQINNAIFEVINRSSFIGGEYLIKFEEEFANYQNTKYCIGVGNGTDALEIAIECLNLPKGCEIIVPANSFIATSEAVTRTGHKVVFCDCDENNYTISIKSLKDKITSDTKAIIPVHLYGHPCDMDSIISIANKYGLKVIEDCAQAHGAEYKGTKVGGFGDLGTFSFYPGKNLGAYGDGGAIVTNNEDLARKCRMISNHGRIDKYGHEFEGRNSRLDALQAAILSVKLLYLNEWIDSRINVANYYIKYLQNINDIILPKKEDWAKHVYHLFVIRAKNRNELKSKLLKNGVQTGIHYPVALPKLKAYKYLNQFNENFFANQLGDELLSLPIGEHLNKIDLNNIIRAVRKFK